jgi:hypothetical protein
MLNRKEREKSEYGISKSQLDELIKKIENNVEKISKDKGEYTLYFSVDRIKESVRNTIKAYLEKNCK